MPDPEHEAWMKEREARRHIEEAAKARVDRETKLRNERSLQQDQEDDDRRKKRRADEDRGRDADERIRND